jgi:hypothetical protein
MAIQYKGREYEPAIVVLAIDWDLQRVIVEQYFSSGTRTNRLEDQANRSYAKLREWAKEEEGMVTVHKIMNSDMRALKTSRVMVDWI